MTELFFCIDQEKKEKEIFLVVEIFDKSHTPPRIVYADALKKGVSPIDKELYTFLLKIHLANIGISILSDKISTVSVSKIKVPAVKSLEAVKLLALAKKLHFKGKSLFYNPFDKPSIYFKAIEANMALDVEGILSIDGKDLPISQLDLLFFSDPMWCIANQTVMVLPQGIDRALIAKTYPEKLHLEGKKKEQFIEFYEDDEDVRIVWVKSLDQANQAEVIAEQLQVLPILSLTDASGAFANLQMDYGQRGIFSYQEPIGSFRDLVAEKGWEKDLLETGFHKKVVGSSCYYCPLDQVTKTLSFLLELGWKIVDSKGRQVYRHTKTDLNAYVDKEEIVTSGILSYEDHETDVQNVVGAFNRRDRFVQLSPYAVGLVDQIRIENDLGDLTTAEVAKDGLRLKKHQAGILDGFLAKKHFKADILTQSLLERMKAISKADIAEVSNKFRGVLYPYQQEGVNWLNFLYTSNLSGLLADDMGLGKTVQVLAFLSMIEAEGPILIIAPTSLIFNWKKEFEKFLPEKNVYIHSGRDRIKDVDNLVLAEVILTSYAHLRLDVAKFIKIKFSCVVLDEAQNIKNPDSQIAEICFGLQSRMKIAITGTPVENRWDDLWSIFHFLEPELLEDRKDFHAQMVAAQSDDRYLKRVKKKITPFLLRRTKEDVSLDLPEKIVQTVWVDMGAEQREVYESLLSRNRQGLIKKIQEEGIGSHRMQVLEALLRLRQVCCHPHLVDVNLADNLAMSAKLERVMSDTAEVVNEGRKVIIFSQFTEMLGILEDHIKHLGFSYVYLDGSTRDRESVVKKFQEDPSVHVFLMSLKAGGVGLNLTAGDYVFLFDPWWNDAAEKQAIDRAYRLGRKNVVVARRYVVAQSVEEKIMKIKEIKSQIAQGLIEDDGTLASFTMHDLLKLFDAS